MKRKYYKNNADADATKVVVEFVCPNTKEAVTMTLEEWQLSGYEDRMGTSVSAYIKCEKCEKNHRVYLANY